MFMPEATKKEYLDQLQNKYGDFEVFVLSEDYKSTWRKWLDAREDKDFLKKINNRTILDIEVVLDLEEPEKYDMLTKKLEEDKLHYKAYKTGSKGYHFHLIFPELRDKTEQQRKKIKEYLIRKYGCDPQKATSRSGIALEFTAHWKTGKPKELIKEKKGNNKLSIIEEALKEYEAEQERNKLREYLSEERVKFQSLGCGYHNGQYYFATKLWKDGRGFTAVVTNKKEVYLNKSTRFKGQLIGEDEIKKKFGLNYKDDFYDEALDNIFSNSAIERYLFEDTSKITFKSVFDKIVTLLKRYIYFDVTAKYHLVACYRISGFFMFIWKVRARLFNWAEFGAAKSRLTNILHNTGFNSVNLGDWTLPFLQRIIESTRGESHIDDFETLDEEKKKATIRLVKTGYMKGFKAGKTSDKSRRPEVYDLFNTTTLNNTEGLDFISNDRSITIRIPKIENKDYDREPNFEDPIFQEIRDELYILGLKEAERVAEVYPTIKSDKLSGRTFSIIKPELTIAKLISEDLFVEIEGFWQEEIEQRIDIDYESNWEFLAYKKIYELLSTLSTQSTLSTLSTLSTSGYFNLLKDVVEPIGLELYGEEDFKKKKRSMSITIGKNLSREPRFKKREVKGVTQYSISFDTLIEVLKAKRFLNTIQDIVEVVSVDSVESVDTGSYIASNPKKDVLRIIQELNSGDGVSVNTIQETIPDGNNKEKEIVDCLQKLKSEGSIMEVKPDRWMIV